MIQTITSKDTSINKTKVPVLFKKLVEHRLLDWHTINLDLGGGKYDNATEYLKNHYVTSFVLDPYNRSEEHNNKVLDYLKFGKFDSVTLSNVLNIIKEPEVRAELIKNAYYYVKSGGSIFISVYEGDKSGIGKQTGKDKWQENRRTGSYVQEIYNIFRSSNEMFHVKQKYGIITLTKMRVYKGE
jgi:hypothetical protein